MMNEKQIYNRMNKAYEYYFGDEPTDEWYGDDSPTLWRFHRPREKMTYKMVMDIENKIIEIYGRKDKEEYMFLGNYSWK